MISHDSGNEPTFCPSWIHSRNKTSASELELTQSQSHGFVIENLIRELVFLLPGVKNDTSKYDIAAKDNKFDGKENISIKVTGTDTIDCGDIMRVFTSESMTMIVFFYSQANQYTKQINRVVEVNFNSDFHSILFGSVTKKQISSYVEMVKAIPPGKVNDKSYCL